MRLLLTQAVLVCLLAATPAFAHKAETCHASADLLNTAHLSIRVKLNQVRATDAWAMREALKYWSTILDLDYQTDNDPATCNLEILYTTEDSDRIAYTIMPHANGFDGAIHINTLYRTSASRLAEVALLIHEIGHVFGLGHNLDPNSVMNYRDESTSGAAGKLTAVDIVRVSRMHALKQPVSAEAKNK